MSTDTLSLPPSPTAERTPDANSVVGRRPPAIPNPTTVDVRFSPSSSKPHLTPAPHESLLPRENGYQFANDQQNATLTFEIDPQNRDTHVFVGCRFAPVRDLRGTPFPLPGCSYRLHSSYQLVVDFKFTPGSIEQVDVLPEYQIKGAKRSQIEGEEPLWFDPQVGNDGGDIVPPTPKPD